MFINPMASRSNQNLTLGEAAAHTDRRFSNARHRSGSRAHRCENGDCGRTPPHCSEFYDHNGHEILFVVIAVPLRITMTKATLASLFYLIFEHIPGLQPRISLSYTSYIAGALLDLIFEAA